MVLIRVAAKSSASAVAGAIAGSVREHRRAEIQAIGAAAINQAVKAVALARGYLVQDKIELVMIPCFVDVEIHDLTRTAVRICAMPVEELTNGAAMPKLPPQS